MKSTSRLAIDIMVAIVYITCANPLITGLAVHEWLSLGLVIVFIVHVAANIDTVVASLKHRASAGVVGLLNLLLDIALLACLALVIVSGLFISFHLLPTFGLVAEGYWLWMPIHAVSAKVFLALILIHLASHFKWIATLIPRQKNRVQCGNPRKGES